MIIPENRDIAVKPLLQILKALAVRGEGKAQPLKQLARIGIKHKDRAAECIEKDHAGRFPAHTLKKEESPCK